MWVWSESGTDSADTVTFEPADPLIARSDVRLDLVQRVREEIADGVYDTPEKLEIALGRLLDRLEPAE
jgi:hypothetical protein